MLVVLPALVAFLVLNVWILVTSLKSGVYHLRGGGQGTAPHVSFTVQRNDSASMFYAIAGLNVCVVLVAAYIVYVMAGYTYESWLAGQWN
jgi:hypothetical protein